eukprot:6195363-Pleurochrysis_carterae.AAC.7
MTRAFVANGADKRPRVADTRGFESGDGVTPLGRVQQGMKWNSCPASTLGAENAASKITSCRPRSASRTS